MAANPTWSILLIETSQDIQSLIQMSINLSLNSSVQIAQSIAEAFEISRIALPDIILISIESFGIESLQELKAQPITRAIPVIALTERVRRSQQLQIQAYGANAILPYTFESSHLQAVLQALPRSGRTNFF